VKLKKILKIEILSALEILHRGFVWRRLSTRYTIFERNVIPRFLPLPAYPPPPLSLSLSLSSFLCLALILDSVISMKEQEKYANMQAEKYPDRGENVFLLLLFSWSFPSLGKTEKQTRSQIVASSYRYLPICRLFNFIDIFMQMLRSQHAS